MTTDEALEFCKRLDDPKFQSLIGTDFSKATGTTGALLALRAALAERDAKIRELDAWLATTELQGENDSSKFDVLEKPLTRGVLVGLQASNREARKKLRELGLIVEEPT